MNLHVAPIPAAFLDRARRDSLDALGQPVRRLVAKGGEPCRDVLRRAEPGEELILASFSPFVAEGPFREFGPVFILANPGQEEVRRDALPVETEYLRERFVLRAYSPAEEIVDAELVARADAPATLERFLDRDDVAFVHARFPTYGCFACRIDRG